MDKDISYILTDDLELIKEHLTDFPSYDFAADISERLLNLGITANVLATRVMVSHVMVGKWLNGSKPHGKERLKELGMALGLDESGLNDFLLANCYPRLYAKNPLDAACRFILSSHAGHEKVVELYRNFLKLYKLNTYVLTREPKDIATTFMSRDFGQINTANSFENWLLNNDDNFRAAGKGYIPNAELVSFILLYLNGQSINGMYVTADLPVTIKNLLYQILGDKEVAIKGLRAKLIVFGLYENMTEDEIDLCLSMAGLRLLTEPNTRMDCVILTALRCAHERYPYFELNNAERAIKNGDRAITERVQKKCNNSYFPELREFFEQKKSRASACVKYYESGGHKSELDRLFEQYYSDYGASGILDYIRDIMTVLLEQGVVKEAETKEYLNLILYYKGGEQNAIKDCSDGY